LQTPFEIARLPSTILYIIPNCYINLKSVYIYHKSRFMAFGLNSYESETLTKHLQAIFIAKAWQIFLPPSQKRLQRSTGN